MLSERCADCKDEATRAKNCRAGSWREHLVDQSEPLDRDRTLALRDGFERAVEGGLQFEPEGYMPKLDDLATDRERRHQLRALQRLRLIRQRREAAKHAALPIVGRPRDWTCGEATQIAQRQRQQPPRAKCWRQRRYQEERKCAGARPGDDRQSHVVVLLLVVAHRIGR